MPRSNVKYEIASQDADAPDYFLQHAEEMRNSPRSHFPIWQRTSQMLLLILLYLSLSIGLTFYQKWLFKTWKLPLTIVLCHLVVKFTLSALTRCLLECYNTQRRVRLSWQNMVWSVAPPGIASGLDIGLSNWAIELLTISLYTMTKSTTIIFILGFALLFNLERKSWSLAGIVVMISAGLIMFTYKATEFNTLGFLLCLLASFSSGLRWTMAQLIMQKSKLGLSSPVDMIYHMQPWMLLPIIPVMLWFEGAKTFNGLVNTNWSDIRSVVSTTTLILGGAVLAFCMEVAEFMVVTFTSSLTLSISGIFKEICTLALAFELKGDHMSGLNFIGLLMCLGGIILHVLKKVLTTAKRSSSNIELISESVTSNGTKSDATFETNLPLLTTQKSTSLTNLLNEDFSSDNDDEPKEEESSSQVLFNILQRREH